MKKEIIGKVIKDVLENDGMFVLIFTDNTMLEINSMYDGFVSNYPSEISDINEYKLYSYLTNEWNDK